MQKNSASLAQNATYGPFKTPKGVGCAIILATDAGNGAGVVVELDVSYDDGVTFFPIAVLDLSSLSATPKLAALTGPNKHGQVYFDGAQDVSYQVKRTDATGGSCFVWLGQTTTSVG